MNSIRSNVDQFVYSIPYELLQRCRTQGTNWAAQCHWLVNTIMKPIMNSDKSYVQKLTKASQLNRTKSHRCKYRRCEDRNQRTTWTVRPPRRNSSSAALPLLFKWKWRQIYWCLKSNLIFRLNGYVDTVGWYYFDVLNYSAYFNDHFIYLFILN